MESIEAPLTSKNSHHIYQSYVPLLNGNLNRNKVIQKLQSKGIQAQIGTYSSHIQPVYNSSDLCPNSLDIFERAIALPMYYSLEEKDIDFASGSLRSIIKEMV